MERVFSCVGRLKCALMALSIFCFDVYSTGVEPLGGFPHLRFGRGVFSTISDNIFMIYMKIDMVLHDIYAAPHGTSAANSPPRHISCQHPTAHQLPTPLPNGTSAANSLTHRHISCQLPHPLSPSSHRRLWNIKQLQAVSRQIVSTLGLLSSEKKVCGLAKARPHASEDLGQSHF